MNLFEVVYELNRSVSSDPHYFPMIPERVEACILFILPLAESAAPQSPIFFARAKLFVRCNRSGPIPNENAPAMSGG